MKRLSSNIFSSLKVNTNLETYLNDDVITITSEYLVMHMDIAFHEIDKYKLSWNDIKQHDTKLIDWHSVDRYLDYQGIFFLESMTCKSWYYKALLKLGLVAYISKEEALEYLKMGGDCPCSDSKCHDKCHAMYLGIVYHDSLTSHIEYFKTILDKKPHLVHHPFMVCEFILQMNRHWENYACEIENKWKICDQMESQLINGISFHELIESISKDAWQGDPHAQYVLSHLYYRVDDNIDENEDEIGAVWSYNSSQQGYIFCLYDEFPNFSLVPDFLTLVFGAAKRNQRFL